MLPYLEHVNVTVANLDKVVAFIQTALPEFVTRGEGFVGKTSVRWIHLGTDSSYISLESPRISDAEARETYAFPGLNHFGFVVKSVEEIEARLESAGFTTKSESFNQYRKRIYFYDSDSNEYEFIEYLSHDPQERNFYE